MSWQKSYENKQNVQNIKMAAKKAVTILNLTIYWHNALYMDHNLK